MSQGFAKPVDIPQTSDSPTFAGLTLSGLTVSLPVFTDANKALASKSVADTRTALGLGVADSPTLAGLTLTAFSGFVQATAGVLSAAAITDGNLPSALTGKTYNALTLTALATGFSIAGGTTSKTLTVDETISLSAKAPLVSPSFTTPALGTPSAGVLTNCTGLPQAAVVGLTTADGPTFDHVHLTSGQVGFPATQAPSADANTLDDYEEGTWTPVLVGWTNVGTPTVTGRYLKIGRLLWASARIIPATSISATVTTSYITGLPFPLGASEEAALAMADVTTGGGYSCALANRGTASEIYIYPPTTGVLTTGLLISGCIYVT